MTSSAWARAALHVPATFSGWWNTDAELDNDSGFDLACWHATGRA